MDGSVVLPYFGNNGIFVPGKPPA